MKYAIEGFNQEEAVNMQLDIKDLEILRWFIDFYDNMKDVHHDNEVYKWVKYQAIIDDLPVLYINSTDVIARHFKKLCDVRVLKKYTLKQKGTFSCFKTDVNYCRLLKRVEQTTKKSEGVRLKSRTGYDLKVGTNNSSIREYTSIIKDTERIAHKDYEVLCDSNLMKASLADDTTSDAMKQNTRQKQIKKDLSYDRTLFSDDENNSIQLFIEYRKERKKELTTQALKMIINKLIDFKKNNFNICECIDNSILKNYLSVFEFKNNNIQNSTQVQNIKDVHYAVDTYD